MDAQKETTETLKETLGRLSKNYNIPILEVRLSILQPEAHVAYDVMHGSNRVDRITVHQALDIPEKGMLNVMKVNLIRTKLKSCLKYYSRELNAPVPKLELRIFTRQEEIEPTGFLFHNGKAIRPVSMDEIFKII